MRGINTPLVFALKDWVAGNEGALFKYPNLLGVNLKNAFARGIWYAVIMNSDLILIMNLYDLSD